MKISPILQRWWSAPFVRTAVLGALALAGLAGALLIAYELALARVPQHRAALERLVQTQTGLDIRFNELNLRLGWYGPEAVFRRVELGEPGESNVLLRAPELIVGFDAWRSVQTGQLQAGRITLVTPDIDLEHGARGAPASRQSRRGQSGATSTSVDLLQRWQGGRIEIQGGTLRLADPTGSGDALPLQIRRVSLKRSDDDWSGSALVFLPDRLGRSARIVAQLQGDLSRPAQLRGTVRFEGWRLEFAGWRQLLGASSVVTRQLPLAGGGDVDFRVTFDGNRIEKAEGHVQAREVLFGLALPRGSPLNLKRLAGDWRLAHGVKGWQLRVEDLDLGAQDAKAPRADFTLNAHDGGHTVTGTLSATPVDALAPVVGWLVPQINLAGIELQGMARDLHFDWNDTRPAGERLNAAARFENLSLAPASHAFTVTGLTAKLSGGESALDIALEAPRAQLILAQAQDRPYDDLNVASQLRLTRSETGWQLATSLFTLDRGPTQLILSGTLGAASVEQTTTLDIRATLSHTDLATLREIFGDSLARRFGAMATQIAAAGIDRAQFRLQAPLAIDSPGGIQTSEGSVTLRDAQLVGGELWPAMEKLDARLEWSGATLRASLLEGAQFKLAPDLPALQTVRGSLSFSDGRLQRSTLKARWLGGPVTLQVSEQRGKQKGIAIHAQGSLDARQLLALTGIDELSDVRGETAWTGDLSYRALAANRPASWELRAETNLSGVTSELPEPLGKGSLAAVPLRIEASGEGNIADLRITLADRLRSKLILARTTQSADHWRVERGMVRLGSGAAALPAEPLIAVQGHVNKLDLPAYLAIWKRIGNVAQAPVLVADLIASQLEVADHTFDDVRLQARKEAGAIPEVHLTVQNLDSDERTRLAAHLKDTWSEPVVILN